MKSARSNTTAGFTFVEVVISMLLVSIGMVGAMGLASYMSRANQWSERLATASTLGQDKMEELLNTPYTGLSAGSDSVGSFNRSWTVATSNNFRVVNLTVAWDNLSSSGHRLQLSTVRPNPTGGSVILP